MLVPLLLAQASAAIAPVASDRVVIDLLVPPPCADDDVQRLQGEIVVCARREGEDGNRLGDSGTADPTTLPRAELQLADGAVVSAETESADLGMARSQRLMVRFKLKF